MTASTSENFHVDLLPELTSSYYVWDVAGKAISVRLSLDVVDRLSGEIVKKFADVHSRGSELGGFLLGRSAGRSTLFIEDYELVECGHNVSALFLLSDEDKSRMVDQLLHVQNSSPHSVIGFFRSHTRKGLGLDERDLSLFRELFFDARNIFLLVKPFAVKPCSGGFFIWENDGYIRAESSYHQFPFKRSELVIRAREAAIGEAGLHAPELNGAGARKGNPMSAIPRQSAETSSPKPAAGGTRQAQQGTAEFDSQNSVDFILRQASQCRTEERQFSARVDSQPDWNIWPQSPPTVLSRLNGNLNEPCAGSAHYLDLKDLRDDRDAYRAEIPVDRSAARQSPAAPPTSAPSSALAWFRWICILLFIAIVGSTAVEYRTRPAEPAPQAASNALDLSIEHEGNGLVLRWNRKAQPIATAQGGTLQIDDGDYRKKLELTAAQLRSGKVVYFPSSDDVTFELEVTDASGGRGIGESVQTTIASPMPPNPSANGAENP